MKLKPILIETDNINEGWCLMESKHNHITYYALNSLGIQNSQDSRMDIILIDTEAEIVKGDWKHNPALNTTWQHKRLGKDEFAKLHHKDTSKIISSTNKSHVAPFGGQAIFDEPAILSPQSIQLLINYYNKHKCMPESVEVPDELDCEDCHHKYDCNQMQCGITYPDYCNSRGEVDITIPKDKKLYTEEEVSELCYQAMKERGHIPYYIFETWFKENKK